MYDIFDTKKIFILAISVAALIGTFIVSNQIVQPSLAQDLGQDVGLNETGKQTANQSSLLGDPAKMYVPSQPVD
jgi:hypothetical protein